MRLQIRVEPSGRDVGKAERAGAEAAELGARPDHVRDEVAGKVGGMPSGKAEADDNVGERARGEFRKRITVEPGHAVGSGMKEFAGKRIENEGRDRLTVLKQCKRDAEIAKRPRKVHGAVHRIDQPGNPAARRQPAQFLADNAVIGERSEHSLTQQPLNREISGGDEVSRTFAFDAKLRGGRSFAQQIARGGHQLVCKPHACRGAHRGHPVVSRTTSRGGSYRTASPSAPEAAGEGVSPS